MYKTLKCKVCGKEFIGYYNRKYCSLKCRDYFLLHHAPLPESGVRICEECGKKYHYEKGQENWYNGEKKCKRDFGVRSDRFCCFECGKKFALRNTQKTIQEKYGVDNISKLESIKKKKEETCLKHYNVKNPMHDIVLKTKCKEKVFRNKEKLYTKLKEVWKNKSKEEINTINQKRKETCLERYKVPTVFETDKLRFDKEINNKRFQTRKKNNSFNTSKPEQELKRLLSLKFSELKYQYKSKFYPWHCDFYIPELKLYIEYQGHWTHGKHPFNKNKVEDIKRLTIWKEKSLNSDFYRSAVNVWTIRDPKKREYAKENNLNWIEFFTFKDFLAWYQTI